MFKKMIALMGIVLFFTAGSLFCVYDETEAQEASSSLEESGTEYGFEKKPQYQYEEVNSDENNNDNEDEDSNDNEDEDSNDNEDEDSNDDM